jgi:DNA-binding transcriptional LysR family regulator
VAVVPACLVELELSKGELVKPFDMEVSCGRGYFLCANKDAPRFSAGERFTDWLVQQSRNASLALPA